MTSSALQELWDYPSPHTFRATVHADDIDGLAHTNNTVYVKWCEQAAWSHSVTLGLDLVRYRALDRAMAITRSEFDYLQASHEGEQVVVATWIVDWDGKLSMRRHFQIIREDDGVTLLRAAMKFVCIELSTGRPRRMPPEFVAGYSPAILADH